MDRDKQQERQDWLMDEVCSGCGALHAPWCVPDWNAHGEHFTTFGKKCGSVVARAEYQRRIRARESQDREEKRANEATQRNRPMTYPNRERWEREADKVAEAVEREKERDRE